MGATITITGLKALREKLGNYSSLSTPELIRRIKEIVDYGGHKAYRYELRKYVTGRCVLITTDSHAGPAESFTISDDCLNDLSPLLELVDPRGPTWRGSHTLRRIYEYLI